VEQIDTHHTGYKFNAVFKSFPHGYRFAPPILQKRFPHSRVRF